MTVTIAPVQANYARLSFSPRLARGLRRELFREYQELDRDWQALAPMVSLTTAARLAARERTRSLRRLAPRMHASLAACQQHSSSNTFFVTGSSLRPVKQACADGETEDALEANQVHVFFDGQRVGYSNKPVAVLSQHAIERLFERLATTSHPEARAELTSALGWFDLLHSVCESLPSRTRLMQFAIPTETGAFLGQRCGESGLLQVRTWVVTGSNRRIDHTLSALRAWRATPTSDLEGTFRSLLAQPCNQWMKQPYSRNY